MNARVLKKIGTPLEWMELTNRQPAPGEIRVKVVSSVQHAFTKGDVFLLPAVVGACVCLPRGATSRLDVSLPESF